MIFAASSGVSLPTLGHGEIANPVPSDIREQFTELIHLWSRPLPQSDTNSMTVMNEGEDKDGNVGEKRDITKKGRHRIDITHNLPNVTVPILNHRGAAAETLDGTGPLQKQLRLVGLVVESLPERKDLPTR
jgi:hypothetical protein